jgi:hypothetical protein
VSALSKLLTLGQDSCPYSIVMLTMHGRLKASYVPTKQQLRRQRRKLQQQQQQQGADVEMTDAPDDAADSSTMLLSSDQLLAGPSTTGGAAAAAAAGNERLWGCRPSFFRGWGEEESSRVTNTRLRRVLLLHLRVSCNDLHSAIIITLLLPMPCVFDWQVDDACCLVAHLYTMLTNCILLCCASCAGAGS